jgi:histidyl-tRNA synthetase
MKPMAELESETPDDSAPPGDSTAPQLRLLKGTDDSLPEEQIVRGRIIDTLRSTFELYGFLPVETPVLHYFDILASKYAGGDEILKETYKLTDQGGRDLGLRYDLTVPFARLVGMYQGARIRLPFKRYEIGKVFRDGPIKRGRLREFIQCDVDIVGTKNPLAEAELISLADRAFAALGLPVKCEINNRKLLAGIIEEAGFAPEIVSEIVLAVDKLKKVGREGEEKEIRDRFDPNVAPERGPHLIELYGAERVAQWRERADVMIERLFALLFIEGEKSPAEAGTTNEINPAEAGTTNERRPLAALREQLTNENGRRGLEELETCLRVLDALKLKTPIVFMPSLARGLEIYTGTVYEFFLQDESILGSSLAAGGRFDRIIGQFLHPDQPEKAEEYPAVGLSFGLVPVMEALAAIQPERAGARTLVEIVVIPLGEPAAAFAWAERLRTRGIRTELDLSGRRLRKSLDAVNAAGVAFVGIVGEDEVKQNRLTLRDMRSGRQELVDEEQAVKVIRENLWSGPPVDSSTERHAGR